MKASDFTGKRLQKLVKQSQEAEGFGVEDLEGIGQQIMDFARENPAETAAALGAAGGGTIGGLVGDENRLLKALVGAAIGGGGGYILGDKLGQGTQNMYASGDQFNQKTQNESNTENEGFPWLTAAGWGAGALGAGYGGKKALQHLERKRIDRLLFGGKGEPSLVEHTVDNFRRKQGWGSRDLPLTKNSQEDETGNLLAKILGIGAGAAGGGVGADYLRNVYHRTGDSMGTFTNEEKWIPGARKGYLNPGNRSYPWQAGAVDTLEDLKDLRQGGTDLAKELPGKSKNLAQSLTEKGLKLPAKGQSAVRTVADKGSRLIESVPVQRLAKMLAG